MFKEHPCEEFGRRLDSNYSSANKVFWQTICRLRGKNLSTTTSIKDSAGNMLRDKNVILSRRREYFEDLLNPVKATHTDTSDTINFGKEKAFTLTKVAVVIKALKSGKAAGERNSIRNVEDIERRRSSLIAKGVSDGVETWKNTERLTGMCDHSYIQERRLQSVQIIEECQFLALQERCMPSALKGNDTEK